VIRWPTAVTCKKFHILQWASQGRRTTQGDCVESIELQQVSILLHFSYFNFNLFCIYLIHEGNDPSDMELVNTLSSTSHSLLCTINYTTKNAFWNEQRINNTNYGHQIILCISDVHFDVILHCPYKCFMKAICLTSHLRFSRSAVLCGWWKSFNNVGSCTNFSWNEESISFHTSWLFGIYKIEACILNQDRCWRNVIPLVCAECDNSSPFSEASSIPLCDIIFPATLLHQLFFHPPSLHLAIYFLVYLLVCWFQNHI
jgi:hypothetical protein